MVKVSVVIPFYNVEDYLRECLDSIVNQTLEDIEIICVNDGSTDNSLKIVEEFANSDDRIKIFSQENKGASASRNHGIKKSQGDYIYFMDSDDILELNALEELYDFSLSNDLDILIFKMIAFDDETGEKRTLKYYEMPFLKPFNEKVFNYKNLGDNALRLAVSPPGKLFKRDLIHSIEFLEGYIFEDNLYFAEAMLKAERVSFLDRYYYNRRMRQNSVMSSKTIKFADCITIANKIIELFKEENVYEYFKKPMIEKKIASAYNRFSQVDSEYKEEFFQRIKEDFGNFSKEFEEDDVFKHEIKDVLRYKFRAALISDNYRDYELKCDLYQKQKKLDTLKKKQEKLEKENKKLEAENKQLKKEIKSEKKAFKELSNSNSWKITKPIRKISHYFSKRF